MTFAEAFKRENSLSGQVFEVDNKQMWILSSVKNCSTIRMLWWPNLGQEHALQFCDSFQCNNYTRYSPVYIISNTALYKGTHNYSINHSVSISFKQLNIQRKLQIRYLYAKTNGINNKPNIEFHAINAPSGMFANDCLLRIAIEVSGWSCEIYNLSTASETVL